jgi:peptidoglycan/xylan/chitin deacetylase (PgdA/CDA1 family)
MFTILLYHGIELVSGSERPLDATDREYVLRRTRFEQHIDYLARHRIPVSSLDACVRGDDDRANPVVLTFDDGDLSGYTMAAPILESYGFRADFFIVSQWVGRPGFMTAGHLRDLFRRGHGIHSHSRTHPVLPSLGDAQIEDELTGSRADLEAIVGVPVTYFSIPGGAYDHRVVSAARRAGYFRMLNSVEGYNDGSKGAFLLRRFTPRAYTSVRFVGSVCRHPTFTIGRLALKRSALSAAKAVLGGAQYRRLRGLIVSNRDS